MGGFHSICGRKKANPRYQISHQTSTLLKLSDGSTFQEGAPIKRTANVLLIQGIAPGGSTVIIKKYTLKSIQIPDLESINTMIEILNKWNHPNLVRYYIADYNKSNNDLIFISEYIPFNFEKILLKTQKKDQIKRYIRDILGLLKFLYSKKITDVNLKASNIMITKSETIKIRDYIANDYLSSVVTQPNHREDAKKEDKEIFYRNNDFIELAKILKEFYKISQYVQIDAKISKHLVDFICMLEKSSLIDHKDLIFEELLVHPFFSEKEEKNGDHFPVLSSENQAHVLTKKKGSQPFVSEAAFMTHELNEEDETKDRDFAEVFYKEVIKKNLETKDPGLEFSRRVKNLSLLQNSEAPMIDSKKVTSKRSIDEDASLQIKAKHDELLKKMMEQFNS